MDVESQATLDEAINRASAMIDAKLPKLQTLGESLIASLFGNLGLSLKALDGTIVQSDPITISIPKLTIWLKLPKEKEA